jgi:hypothetical protein
MYHCDIKAGKQFYAHSFISSCQLYYQKSGRWAEDWVDLVILNVVVKLKTLNA